VRAEVQEEANRKGGKYANDPPFQAWPVARIVGDHYRAKGFNSAAIGFYEKALKAEPNDGFSLSGMAQAYAANGDREKASHYAGRLAYVWSHADPNLRWMEEVRKLGLDMKPIAETPAVEHMYDPASLASFGPGNWVPFTAPKLDVLNINGKPVHLEDYRGKNIVLVFFLGEACVHCVGQLNSINAKMKEFEDQNTVVLGVCSASPKSLKESVKLTPVKIKFLSDTNHENARNFSSYDDFEEIELHSTILIDKQGKVRWKRTGGDPFMNIDFLLKELARINQGP
ncbi:MAG: redoxin domain-containing protein, partial [Armatimonadota bacterium]